MCHKDFARFGSGLTAGVLLTALTVIALAMAGQQLEVDSGPDALKALTGSTVAWVWNNLGWSLPVFAAVIVLYATTLERLKRALGRAAPADEVAQADHLTDVWTSLFFGVGVIWTAIGMRGALVEALGAPGDNSGGVEVLQRMVDGGILLALSTTIFGVVGGYFMRAWKTLVVGGELKRYYEADARRDLAALRVSVSAIERGLGNRLTPAGRPGPRGIPESESGDSPAAAASTQEGGR